MASNFDYSQFNNTGVEKNNKVGVIESMLSGVASGLIAIPKGFFSLGASLMDLGVNSGKAAQVEQWFDEIPAATLTFKTQLVLMHMIYSTCLQLKWD